jgi:hypothetical protein
MKIAILILLFASTIFAKVDEVTYNCVYTSSELKKVTEESCEPDTFLIFFDGETISKDGFSVDITDRVVNGSKLTIDKDTTISAGTYYYDDLTINSGVKVSISGEVKIYANIVHINDGAEINCGGEPNSLFIGSYKNNFIMNKEAKISATIFVMGNLQVKKDTLFKGLIVTTDKNSGTDYLNANGESCASQTVPEVDPNKFGYFKLPWGNEYQWDNVKEACSDLGMSFPTLNELKEIKVLTKDSGEFWSSEEISSTSAYMFRMSDSLSQSMQKTNVKAGYCSYYGDLPTPKTWSFDFYRHPSDLEWSEAKSLCESKGMKLPNYEEMKIISKNGGISGEYWTETEQNSNNAYIYRIDSSGKWVKDWYQTMQKVNGKKTYCYKDTSVAEIPVEIPATPEEPNPNDILATDVDTIVEVNAGTTEIIDSEFISTISDKTSLKDLGIVEITNSDASPGDISYLQYDDVLAKSLNLKVTPFGSNGQIIFQGSLKISEWEKLFKTVKFASKTEDLTKNFKVTFTLKNSLGKKDIELGAIPENPETTESLKSTLAKWENQYVSKIGYYGDLEKPLNIVTTNKASVLSNHVSTGLGVEGLKGDKGQIDWIADSKQEIGGIPEKIIINFSKPITDITVGFSGLGGRFIDSAKAVYEFYYKGVLVRSRGKLDRSEDFDGDGYIATNLTTTNLIVDKMIFAIEIEGDNLSNANYSVRYITANLFDNSGESGNFTKTYIVKVIEKKYIHFGDIFELNGKISTKVVKKSFPISLIVAKIDGTETKITKDYNLSVVNEFGEIIENFGEIEFINLSRFVKELNVSTIGENFRFKAWNNREKFFSDKFSVRPKKFILGTKNSELKVGEDFNLSISVLDGKGEILSLYSGKLNDTHFQISGIDNISGFPKEINISKGTITIENLKIEEEGDLNISISEAVGNEFAKIDENDTSLENRLIENDFLEISVKSNMPEIENGDCGGVQFGKNGYLYYLDNLLLSKATDLNLTMKIVAKENSINSSIIAYTLNQNEFALKKDGEDLAIFIAGDEIPLSTSANEIFEKSGSPHIIQIHWKNSGVLEFRLDGVLRDSFGDVAVAKTLSEKGILTIGGTGSESFEGEIDYIKITSSNREAEWDMNSINSNGVENITYPAYYNYGKSLRWADAKNFCENMDMKLPEKNELEPLKSIFKSGKLGGEFWTNTEISSQDAYMFRFDNDYTKTWTQSMQKVNYKTVFCVGNSKLHSLQAVGDIKVVNSEKCSLKKTPLENPQSGFCNGISLNKNENSGYLEFNQTSVEIPEDGYKYSNSLRWADAKNFCENREMKLPDLTDLEKLKNIFKNENINGGEFWTSREIGSQNAYFFRFQNNFTQTWTQSMQKVNYKNVYCITDANSYTLFNNETDFNLTMRLNGALEKSSTLVSYNNNKIELSSKGEILELSIGSSKSELLLKGSELFDNIDHTLFLKFNGNFGVAEIYFDGLIVDFVKNVDWIGESFSNSGKLIFGKDGDNSDFFIGDLLYLDLQIGGKNAIWDMEKLNRDTVFDKNGVYNLSIFGDVEPLNNECNLSSADFENNETNESLEENLTFSFNVTDIDNEENISTKISGEQFKLKVRVSATKESNDAVNGFKHPAPLKWDPAKTVCEAQKGSLPTISQLENLKQIFKDNKISGEFWSGTEIDNSNAYMYRFDNDYTKIWYQPMQKVNSKSVYCVTGEKNVITKVDDFNFTGNLKISLIGVEGVSEKSLDIENDKSGEVSFFAMDSSKNVGAKVTYNGKDFYSEDNFSIRPDRFAIKSLPTSSISGTDFNFSITAINKLGFIVQNYFESNETSLNFQYLELKENCDRPDLNLSKLSFSKGLSFQTLSYSEIGELNFSISEKDGFEFAKIDRDDTSAKMRFITPISGITDFNISKIVVNSSLIDKEQNWTYFANDLNDMSAKFNLKLMAVNSKMEKVRNFRKGCYSSDIETKSFLNVIDENNNIVLQSKISKGEEINISNIEEDQIVLTKNFSENDFENGEANTSSNINFVRFTNKPLNPLRVEISNIILLQNYLTKTELNISTTDKDANFYYSRVIVGDKITEDLSINIDYLFEIYLSDPKNKNPEIFGDSNISLNWYQHLEANSSLFDENISLHSKALNIAKKTLSLPEDEVNPENIGSSQSYSVEIEAPKYLIYNKYDGNSSSTYFEVEYYIKGEEDKVEEIEFIKTSGDVDDIMNIYLVPSKRVDW